MLVPRRSFLGWGLTGVLGLARPDPAEAQQPAGAADEAQGGLVTAEGTSFPRPLIARFRDMLSITDDGARGNGADDATPGINRILAQWAEIDSGRRRPKLYAPAGIYLLGSGPIVVADILGEGELTRGNLVLSAAGRGNTVFRAAFASGDVFKLTSGKVYFEDFTIDSDGVARGKSKGRGHGIMIDNTDGSTPAASSIAQFGFSRLQILNQPGHGVHARNVENSTWQDIQIAGCGGDGMLLDGRNHGGQVRGIGNTLINCRFIYCGGRGLRNLLTLNLTTIGLQVLICGGKEHIYDTGLNTKHVNPDVEGDKWEAVATANLYGFNMGGKNQAIENATIQGFRTYGIRIAGTGCTVKKPRINNTAEKRRYLMEAAVAVVAGVGHDIDMEDVGNAERTGVVAPFSPFRPAGGNRYRYRGVEVAPRRIVIEDDFAGMTLDASKWAAAKGSDALALLPAIPAERSGVVRITAGADPGGQVAANGSHLYGPRHAFPLGGSMRFEARVALSAVTGVQAFFGLNDQNAALRLPFALTRETFAAAEGTADACGLLFDTNAGAPNWHLVAAQDGRAQRQDTGLSPAPGALEEFWIELAEEDGIVSATFFRDGAAIGALTDALTASVALAPYFIVSSTAGETRSLDVERFRMFIDRVS